MPRDTSRLGLGRSEGTQSAMRKKKKARAGTPSGHHRETTRRWRLGEDGNIINFSFMALREDVLLRLRRDELYTLEECKVLLKELLKYASAWAEVELAQLMYLSELRAKLFPERERIAFQWPTSGMPDIPLDFGAVDVTSAQNPKFKLSRMVEELNKSLIRMVDTLLQQRKERLIFGARLLEDIEQVDAFR
eukprot:Hpha_TRINITY_DN25039_c0_g1::TRINITY_DN25039_c0_g1_i1::g.109711::m.109711